MQVGDLVRLLAPWAEFWPGEYAVAAVEPEVIYLEGIDGAFDPAFVEAVDGAD